jgi:hypothetical protein
MFRHSLDSTLVARVCAGAMPLTLSFLSACSSSGPNPDLPPGWQDAELVEQLTQAPCAEPGVGWEVISEIDTSSTATGFELVYDDAQFRCEQSVEAYARKQAGSIDLLVQPVDMHPAKVAGCDCLYRVSMEIPAPAGTYRLGLYRRWDSLNDPNPVIEISRSDLTIP